MRPILLLTGAPASGKSTVARLIAERSDHSLHLQVDDLRHMMAKGLAVPRADEPWTDEVTEQFRWARDTACFMAERYAKESVSVVIDDVCVPADFPDHYTALLERVRVHKVLLLPSQSALVERLRLRGGAYDQDILAHVPWIYANLGAMPKDGWTVLDSSEWTVGETLAAVLASFEGEFGAF